MASSQPIMVTKRAGQTRCKSVVKSNATAWSSAMQMSGDSVVLVGFGTFAVKERAARTGRNPQTGNPIKIAAAKIPGFKAGKALKDAVN